MQILALARKWRPRNFSQLVGQTHVVEALTHALAQQRLHHAYLFSGTRGVGKTTLGRVFAKALNCEQGITPEPCGECDACRAIDEGRFVDLIEIDAASRTKVEDTRELLDNVQYLPAQGRFKIYLIDEVHMLSQSSFNALLKTLEEPPEHVKFILATTEPHKLPITVLSRCLKFNLQRLQPALIAEHLRRVAEAEGFTITDGALHLLAHHADGSVRDALSLLDQAVVQGSGQVDEATVRDMLGLASEAALTALLEALADRDAQALADVLAQLAQEGADYPLLLEALAEQFHRMALLQLLGSAAPDQDISLADTFARRFDPVRVQQCYQTALLGQKELQWAPSARVAFEMAAMRMLAFEPLTSAKKPAPQFEKTPTQAQNAPQSGKKPAAPPAAEPASGKNGGGPVSEPPLDTAPLVEAPTELNDLRTYLFANFESEDQEVLSTGLCNLDVFFQGVDLEQDFSDLAYSLEPLAEEDLEGIVHPDADPSLTLPVGLVAASAFTPLEHVQVILLEDQTPVEPNSPNHYEREFTEPADPQCFDGAECQLLRSMNDIVKENFLMTIPYEMHKDYRWVEMCEEGSGSWGILARSWCEEEAWGEGGDNAILQSYSIDVFLPSDTGAVRFMALWSQSDIPGFGDDTIEYSIKLGMYQVFDATDEYLEEH